MERQALGICYTPTKLRRTLLYVVERWAEGDQAFGKEDPRRNGIVEAFSGMSSSAYEPENSVGSGSRRSGLAFPVQGDWKQVDQTSNGLMKKHWPYVEVVVFQVKCRESKARVSHQSSRARHMPKSSRSLGILPAVR